ncbi:MAG TPA: hypothetical protein VF534_21095 [Paraburkholderia sp.]
MRSSARSGDRRHPGSGASRWAVTDGDAEVLAGRRVVMVDPADRTVRTAAGETLAYGRLVWAAVGERAS